MQTGFTQVLAAEYVLDQAGEHPDARHRESHSPTDAFADVSDDQRRYQRANVDPHIKEGESRVAPRVALAVKLSDNRADIALQESGAEHQQHQPEVEEDLARHRQTEFTERDQHAANQHRAPLSEH